MIRRHLIWGLTLGLLMGPCACRNPTAPEALGGMTGLWLICVGPEAVMSLTQEGDRISGYAHLVDSPTTCWDDNQRLPVSGSVTGSGSVRLTIRAANPIEVTGNLSSDQMQLLNVCATSWSCTIGGYPWEFDSERGWRITPLDGNYEFRLQDNGTVKTISATLSQTMVIGPNGEFPVTVRATLGPEWPCSSRVLTARYFYLHGISLHGEIMDGGRVFMNVDARLMGVPNGLSGSFFPSGYPEVMECFAGWSGSITITKR